MSRPYPSNRRRRPGRRPPHRGPGRRGPRPGGFSSHGLGAAYDAFLPVRGRQRRGYFNAVAGLLTLVAGYTGAVLGASWAGPPGLALGLVAGLVASARFLTRQRFLRH